MWVINNFVDLRHWKIGLLGHTALIKFVLFPRPSVAQCSGFLCLRFARLLRSPRPLAPSQPSRLPAFLPSSFSALALEAAVAEAADRAAAFPALWDCPRYSLRYGAVLRRKKIHLSLEDQVKG